MKRIVYIVLAILVAGAAIWYAYNLDKAASSETARVDTIDPVIQKQVETSAAKIAEKVDKNGLKHTIYEMVKEIDQSAVNAVKSELLDSTAQLKIAREQIRQIMVINTHLSVQNQRLTKSRDEQSNTLYSFKDRWLDASVHIPYDTTQHATLNLTHDADLIPIQYNKKRLLRTPVPMIDVYSTDERVTIGGLKTLTIKPNEPSLGLSIDAATEYDFKTGVLLGGPAVSLDIKRFNVQGKYLLDPSTNEWRWVVNGNYKILKL